MSLIVDTQFPYLQKRGSEANLQLAANIKSGRNQNISGKIERNGSTKIWRVNHPKASCESRRFFNVSLSVTDRQTQLIV